MAYLPLANILHYKLRSALSSLGIGIGICMLITLSGLSRGSLNEVAGRWESVDADLMIFPRGWGENASLTVGSGLSDNYARKILTEHGDIVERVVPVFLWQMKLAGQNQTVAGVDPNDWWTLTGGRRLIQGRLFDPDNRFAKWIERKLLDPPAESDGLIEIAEADLAHSEHNGLEIVIDTRLAKAGGFRLNQTVFTANHHWKIVGIVPAGVMTRLFMPRRTAQFLFGDGSITKSTLMFVKLSGGVDIGTATGTLKRIGLDVIPLDRYRGMLIENFGIMYLYVDTVNAVSLVIAFLFVMITLYTMVLQRTREIAILKANGASNFFLLRQVLGESVLLTAAGTAAGIGMSFLAGFAIETLKPLLTVTITWQWLALAAAAGAAGAVLSALYPAWLATRVDIAAALRLE